MRAVLIWLMIWERSVWLRGLQRSESEISVQRAEEPSYTLDARVWKRKRAQTEGNDDCLLLLHAINTLLLVFLWQMTWRHWLPVGCGRSAWACIGQSQNETPAPSRTLSDSTPPRPRLHPLAVRMASVQPRVLAASLTVIVIFIISSSSSHAPSIPRVSFPLGKSVSVSFLLSLFFFFFG